MSVEFKIIHKLIHDCVRIWIGTSTKFPIFQKFVEFLDIGWKLKNPTDLLLNVVVQGPANRAIENCNYLCMSCQSDDPVYNIHETF